VVKIGDFELHPTEDMLTPLKSYDGSDVLVGIRAENMEAVNQPAENALKVQVSVVEPLGSQNLLTIPVENHTLKVSTHPDFHVAPGSDIWIRFPGDKIRWIDPKTSKAITPSLEEVMA
jgi:multiple sugar transport system ATP-binding protein